MTKILINSLGCPKNLVDSEIMAKTLSDAGYSLTADINVAEIAIINTCSFIRPAVEEAIDIIQEAVEYKKNGILKKVIVTGCLVERYKEEIIQSIPEVDFCIGIDGYNDIVSIIEENNKKVTCGPNIDVSFMNKPRLLSDNTASTYIKISEGCDNHCTYCTIPRIRGKFRSRTIDDIYSEVQILCSEYGIKELTLVAQDTTAYGRDIYGKLSLCELLNKLETIKELKWIRLLYCYPELITDELISTIKNNKKVLHYIDIPLQHSSDKILKLMGRKGTRQEYGELIDKLRKNIPDIVLRTTFIVGFPKETEKDFQDLLDFLREYRFDRAGFFEYYKEEGTPAYNIEGHISQRIKTKRYNEAIALQQNISLNKNNNRIGQLYSILIHGISDDGLFYVGRSYAEADEIDPVIYVSSKEPLCIKDMVTAKVVAIEQDTLIAEVE